MQMKGFARIEENTKTGMPEVAITWKGYIAVATFMLSLVVTSASAFGVFLNLKIGHELADYTENGLPARNSQAVQLLEVKHAENAVRIESLTSIMGGLAADLKDLAKSIRESTLVQQ